MKKYRFSLHPRFSFFRLFGAARTTRTTRAARTTRTALAATLLLFAPFAALHAQSAAQSATQEAIKVDRVDFNSLRNDWIQMEIELSCEGNPREDARDRNFVENIKVKAYIAYERDARTRAYDYYTSEVEIIIMEKGDDNNVYFYLPGLIVERDRLKTDPDFFYVEVSVDGQVQKPQTTAMSRNIPDLNILNSFTSRADAEGAANEHLLMPIYLVNGLDDIGRVSDLPAFLRRDVRP
jgi:hypothetical protein